MSRFLKINLIVVVFINLLCCGKSEPEQVKQPDIVDSEMAAVTEPKTVEIPVSDLPIPESFTTIEWIDLLPEDDLEALLNPPKYISEIEEGSGDDMISGQIQNSLSVDEGASRYQQALSSGRVIEEMDGKDVRIPGFVVPLEFGEEMSITEFFLVPFFGACIHLPPPPPNQIIYVKFAEGFVPDAIDYPFWISGTLKVESNGNEKATAAYTMTMYDIEPYLE